MLHVSKHDVEYTASTFSCPKTSIATNVAVAQPCAPMCASYAKVLGNGVLTRAMLSQYYAGIAHDGRMMWRLKREGVVEERIALVGVFVRHGHAPHAAGNTRRTLKMTLITCLFSASVTRLNSRRGQGAPQSPRKTRPIRATRIITHTSCCDARWCFSMEYVACSDPIIRPSSLSAIRI